MPQPNLLPLLSSLPFLLNLLSKPLLWWKPLLRNLLPLRLRRCLPLWSKPLRMWSLLLRLPRLSRSPSLLPHRQRQLPRNPLRPPLQKNPPPPLLRKSLPRKLRRSLWNPLLLPRKHRWNLQPLQSRRHPLSRSFRNLLLSRRLRHLPPNPGVWTWQLRIEAL